VDNYIPKGVLSKKNKAQTWEYGYNEKYNFVCISKTGRVGQVINISGYTLGYLFNRFNVFKDTLNPKNNIGKENLYQKF